jgi:hypothetical protein
MPALNFQARFADAVERGDKRQTVRPIRKRPIVVGDTLFLKTGQRTKKCRSLRNCKCRSVSSIVIDCKKGKILGGGIRVAGGVWGIELDPDDFARRDGFASSDELFEWFAKQYGDLFEGVLIQWW